VGEHSVASFKTPSRLYIRTLTVEKSIFFGGLCRCERGAASKSEGRRGRREEEPGQVGRKTDETAAARDITLRGAQREEDEGEGEVCEGFRRCPRHVCPQTPPTKQRQQGGRFVCGAEKKKKKKKWVTTSFCIPNERKEELGRMVIKN